MGTYNERLPSGKRRRGAIASQNVGFPDGEAQSARPLRLETGKGAGMPKLTPALALALPARAAAAPAPDDATRAYMTCVRRNAERLEPSGDPPQGVARAAVFLCQRDEMTAFNARGRPDANLRDTALFYGAGQATAARACRVAQRCGLAPLPNSN